MNGISLVIILVIVVLAVIGMMLTILITVLRAQAKQISTTWTKQGISFCKGPDVANYRGHASVTVPLRGISVVGLTAHDLRLIRMLSRREFVIPLDQITRIELLRAWKGSFHAGSPMIVVHYYDGEKEDALGLAVNDPQGWLDAIASAADVSAT